MTADQLPNAGFEHLFRAQITDYETTECKSRPLAERLRNRTLLQRALLMLHVHRSAGPESAACNLVAELNARIDRLTSTPEGIAKIEELSRIFPR